MSRAALLALLSVAACRGPVAPAPSAAPAGTAGAPSPDYVEAILSGDVWRKSGGELPVKGAVLDSLMRALLRDGETPCHVYDPVPDDHPHREDAHWREARSQAASTGTPDTVRIHARGPRVVVDYAGAVSAYGADSGGRSGPLSSLRLTRVGETRPFQTLDVRAYYVDWEDGNRSGVETPDLDGDGYADLLYAYMWGSGYANTDIWLYRPEAHRYGGVLAFNGNADMDPATGVLWNYWKSGCCEHGLDVYAFRDGLPRHTRQWVTWSPVVETPDDPGGIGVEATAVCERRGRRMVEVEIRPGWDWHGAPGWEE